MIEFRSGGRLIQEVSELPAIPARIKKLYFDFETSSGDHRVMSINPWRFCTAIGIAIAFQDGPISFVPRHLMVTGWWQNVVNATDVGIGHNVLYDAHVSKNDLGVDPPMRLSDTLTAAKLIDSDRTFKGGYGLDKLAQSWLGRDITEFEWRMGPYLVKNKDYGNIPIDILAEYACVDIEATRALHKFIEDHMPAESLGVWDTEQRVTRIIYEMEHRGVKVDPTKLKLTQIDTLKKLLDLDEKIDERVGRSFRATVNADCYDVLCVQFGLPILAWTEPNVRQDGTISEPGPSFDADALQLYRNHPAAPTELLDLMIAYRELDTFNNLFLSKWDELVDEYGVMHPSTNQVLRTGRMSMSNPNMQQLNHAAKFLIEPPEGYAILSWDASQIEFRGIAHYIENKQWIDAYNADPWTDAHTWVAGIVGTDRTPAKTINFMMGFGAGKKKTISALSVNKGVVGEVIAAIDAGNPEVSVRQQMILDGCARKALQVYDTYHAVLPELKQTSRGATQACLAKGYVKNHYGRRRHLPAKAAHVAFNAAVQSTAADYLKERLVAIHDEFSEVQLAFTVHDAMVAYAPLELLEGQGDAPELEMRITKTMNEPNNPLRVPLRTSIGWSPKNWADCEEREIKPH